MSIFPRTDLSDEIVRWGKEVNAIEEFRGEVADVFVAGVADRKDQRPDSLAFEFENFANAECLCERGEALKDVGDVPGGVGTHEDPSSLRVEWWEGKCSGAGATFSGGKECRNTCSGSCQCKERWRRWLRDKRGRGCDWLERVSGSVSHGGWFHGTGCRRDGGC